MLPEFPSAARVSGYVCDLEYRFSPMNVGSYGATEPHLWLMSKIFQLTWDNCRATCFLCPSLCFLFLTRISPLPSRSRTLLGGLGRATFNFAAVVALLCFIFPACSTVFDLAKQRRKFFLGVSGVGKNNLSCYSFWLCVCFLFFYLLSVANPRRLSTSSVHTDSKVQTVKDDLDHAPRVGGDPQRRKKHFGIPAGGRPREVLNSTTSTDKPKANQTFASVNVERTELEHATMFTVGGPLCARPDNSFDSGVHSFVNSGATNDFMSMHTAKRAQLSLYKISHPGHVMTAGGVQGEVLYYTKAYVRIGEFVS